MGQIAWLTLKLAAVSTLVLLLLATPLSWWLARTRRWWSEVVFAVTAVPIILPPTVIGFYLLILLGPADPLIRLLKPLGVRTLAFTFTGLVIGSVAYSLPFAVQPLRNAFRSVGEETVEAARLLGASRAQIFAQVALPMSRHGVLTAAILCFAHTVGEFGIVLMIGGSIPGRTQVLSTRIYELVEALQWRQAHLIAGALVAFAFVTVLSVLLIDSRIAEPLQER